MAARLGVGPQPVEDGVVDGVVGGDDEQGRQLGVRELPGVQDAYLEPRVEGAPVERVEDPLVRPPVRASVGTGQRWLALERPFAGVVVEEGDIGVRGEGRHQVAGLLQLRSQCRQFAVHAAGAAVVREDAAPVGLGTEVQGVPVPVHDPFGVEAERRVREVDLLPGAPADALAGAGLPRDLRVLPGQPGRGRVRGHPEDHGADTTT
jgi:hypothetical protein